MDAGNFTNFIAGRTGRMENLPPQFGQMLPSTRSAQSRQNVHSNVHITASIAVGGKSLSQHSQFGLSSSMAGFLKLQVSDAATCHRYQGPVQGNPGANALRQPQGRLGKATAWLSWNP